MMHDAWCRIPGFVEDSSDAFSLKGGEVVKNDDWEW
jgi:hypothetical protein